VATAAARFASSPRTTIDSEGSTRPAATDTFYSPAVSHRDDMTTDEGDDPTVPIVCSECDTTSHVPLSEVAETVERHNERVHDGADHAEVDPALREQLADLVAEDMGLLDDEPAEE